MEIMEVQYDTNKPNSRTNSCQKSGKKIKRAKEQRRGRGEYKILEEKFKILLKSKLLLTPLKG